MKIEDFSFGRIRIDGAEYEHDVVIDRGKVGKGKKKPSKPLRERYGDTPLSAREDIPWNCRRLIVGTGMYGSLPVMDEVGREAAECRVELVLLPTSEAIERINEDYAETNAVLHVTC